MPTPTVSEVQTQISNMMRIQLNLNEYLNTTSSTNFIANQDTFLASLESDYEGAIIAGLDGTRAALNVSINAAVGTLAPLIVTMGQAIDAPETDPQTLMTRLYDYMIENSQFVASRGFTYGSPSAGGSNTGNGEIIRLNKDENDLAIENTFPELKTAECVADEFSGASASEEQFQFHGVDPAKDSVKLIGSGKIDTLRCVSARDSQVSNASFTNFAGTTSVPTAITSWTTATIGNAEIDQTNYYRDDPSDGGNPASLKFTGNNSVLQLFSTQNITLNPQVPYVCHLYYNRQVGSGDGTLTLTLGGVTATVALSAQTGWNKLNIPIGCNSWFKDFNTTASAMQLKIELSSHSTGSVLIDDVIFTPFQSFDGLYYCPVDGPTKFLKDDIFTWTDSATESVNQYWFWRLMGRYLPHATGGSITWADPT